MEGGDVCTSCGACCAALRVGFSEDETTRRGGSVPWPLTEPSFQFAVVLWPASEPVGSAGA